MISLRCREPGSSCFLVVVLVVAWLQISTVSFVVAAQGKWGKIGHTVDDLESWMHFPQLYLLSFHWLLPMVYACYVHVICGCFGTHDHVIVKR